MICLFLFQPTVALQEVQTGYEILDFSRSKIIKEKMKSASLLRDKRGKRSEVTTGSWLKYSSCTVSYNT